MGCIITFKVSGKNFSYETKLSRNEISLQTVTEEIAKNEKLEYFEDDHKTRIEGHLPSILAIYLNNKSGFDLKNTKQKLINSLLKGEELIGNSSLDGLTEIYPTCDFNGLSLENDEDVLFVRHFNYMGVGFGGKIKVGNKNFFIIKNLADAKLLKQYLETRKNLNNVSTQLDEIPENVQKALNFIKTKKNCKNNKTALMHFFNSPDEYLFKNTSEGIDVHTTLSNFIQQKFQKTYVREYENQLINSIVNSANKSKKNNEYYISEDHLEKILKQYNVKLDKDQKMTSYISKYFRENGYPIDVRITKTKEIGFSFSYNTFENINILSTISTTELAVRQTNSEFVYNIYSYAGKYYVSTNKIITKDSYANQFDSLEEAKKYVEHKIKTTSILSGFSRDRIGISENEKNNFRFHTTFKGLSENTVFSGITNYEIPFEVNLNYLNEELNNLLRGSIDNFFEFFEKNYKCNLRDKIDSYEKAVIFMYELSKLSKITDKTIKNAIDIIDNLQTKDFLVIKKMPGENNYLVRNISDEKEESWEQEERFSVPVIVPLKALANQINESYGSELVKIITESDFKDLPKDINKDAKGFIYNGIIYINATKAELSDLSHELGHLILGMIKSNNISQYLTLIEKLGSMDEIRRAVNEKRQNKHYEFLAEEDIVEEVFVDLLGQFIVRNNKNLGFVGNSVNDIANDAIEKFGSSMIKFNTLQDLFRNFSTNMKRILLAGNGLDLDESLMKQRKATNFIKDKIESKDIIMNCE